jgi:hypothetical protein
MCYRYDPDLTIQTRHVLSKMGWSLQELVGLTVRMQPHERGQYLYPDKVPRWVLLEVCCPPIASLWLPMTQSWIEYVPLRPKDPYQDLLDWLFCELDRPWLKRQLALQDLRHMEILTCDAIPRNLVIALTKVSPFPWARERDLEKIVELPSPPPICYLAWAGGQYAAHVPHRRLYQPVQIFGDPERDQWGPSILYDAVRGLHTGREWVFSKIWTPTEDRTYPQRRQDLFRNEYLSEFLLPSYHEPRRWQQGRWEYHQDSNGDVHAINLDSIQYRGGSQ